jgi:hypothetical protein
MLAFGSAARDEVGNASAPRLDKERLMQKHLIAASLLVFIVSPILADYYVAQDPTTKQCQIVDAKPDGRTMMMVGKSSYVTRALAFMAAGNDYKDVCKGVTTLAAPKGA